MRTTLTIDSDVGTALKELAHHECKPFKQVVNELLRAGLEMRKRPQAACEPFRVEARARGFRPGVDPARLNQLIDEQEIEGFASETTDTR